MGGLYSGLVMLPHTLFALPFALTAVVLASYATPVAGRTILLIVLAFTGARTAAMAFNRLVDQRVDGNNPRTSHRHLPAGLVSRAQVWLLVAVAVALFELAAWALGSLPFILSPAALAVVLAYSFTKYFTALSHWALGLALSIAPVGAYIAVTGRFAPTGILLLAGAVVLWVAGFDIIYSLQDEQFDRRRGCARRRPGWGRGGRCWSAGSAMPCPPWPWPRWDCASRWGRSTGRAACWWPGCWSTSTAWCGRET